MVQSAANLVSYQAVRTYLTSVLDAESQPSPMNPTETARDRIQRVWGRLRTVTEGEFDTLAKRDEISLGTPRVLVEVQVYCEDCSRQFDVAELLDRGAVIVSEKLKQLYACYGESAWRAIFQFPTQV